MEGECVLIHLDISTLDIRYQNTSGTPKNHQLLGNRVHENLLLTALSQA